MTGRFAMPNHLDPLPVFKRFDDIGGHRHAADRLDVATCDGLLISNDRQGLHHCARIARRLFRRQAIEEWLDLIARLEAPAAGDLGELDAASTPRIAQLVEKLADD